MDEADASGPNSTYFAKPGRASFEELAEQMRRSLDDPCVKVVLEAVTGFVMILNEDRQILAANRELLEALGRKDPRWLVGLRPGEAFNCIHFAEGVDGCGTSPHCSACGAVLALLAAQITDAPANGECRLSMYRDGKLEAADFRVRATPLEIGGRRLIAFVLHDVSAMKRREVLEQIFLHDFLNALGGIVGWTELMKEADRDSGAREIAALAGSLKDEVDSQRTLLAAERGELAVEWREFDAAELVAKLSVIFGRHPAARGRTLSIAPLPPDARIVSDQGLLLRILVNMLKNAFEAAEPGAEVGLQLEFDGGAPRFTVRNPGAMPDYVQARLFERSFSTRSSVGRGIGTYSMKLFGERYLGGAVGFTSNAAGGTRFFITLPVRERSERVAAEGAAAARAPEAAGAGSVLLVDDDEALLGLGKLLLTRLGYRVTACRSAMKALRIFSASPGDFDVAITDWNMPEMSGETLAQHLSGVRPGVPILICTGLGESAIATLEGVNVRGVLPKPFTFQTLAEALKRAMARAPSDAGLPGVKPANEPKVP